MKYFGIVALLFFGLWGCSSLPPIEQDARYTPAEIAQRCQAAFPKTPWQFVHRIYFTLPGGKMGAVMGVSTVDPQKHTLHSAVLSLEGLILLEGWFDGDVHIKRAIPPFNSPALAGGMMRDIALIFFRPEGDAAICGMKADGFQGCRYPLADRFTVDVATRGVENYKIEHYNVRNRLQRRIVGSLGKRASGEAFYIYHRIELISYGLGAYHLNLKLIEAHPFTASEGNLQ